MASYIHNNNMDVTNLQRTYYSTTAADYDSSHISAKEPEHDIALSILKGIAGEAGWQSLLDVGAGTCRGIQQLISHSLRFMRLWKLSQYVKNDFKPWKYSEGDGVYYSYSLLDDFPYLQQLGTVCQTFTTRPTSINPLWTCSHVAVLAWKNGGPFQIA